MVAQKGNSGSMYRRDMALGLVHPGVSVRLPRRSCWDEIRWRRRMEGPHAVSLIIKRNG